MTFKLIQFSIGNHNLEQGRFLFCKKNIEIFFARNSFKPRFLHYHYEQISLMASIYLILKAHIYKGLNRLYLGTSNSTMISVLKNKNTCFNKLLQKNLLNEIHKSIHYT